MIRSRSSGGAVSVGGGVLPAARGGNQHGHHRKRGADGANERPHLELEAVHAR